MSDLYEIYYPSGPKLDRVKEMLTTYETVLIRPVGKLGMYAVCTLGAAKEIVAALNAYRTPTLVKTDIEGDKP